MIDIFSLKRGEKVFHLKKKNYWTVSHVDHKNKRVHLYQVTELKTHKTTSAVKFLSKERPIKPMPISKIKPQQKIKISRTKSKANKRTVRINVVNQTNILHDFNKTITMLKFIANAVRITTNNLFDVYEGKLSLRSIQRITTGLCDFGYLEREGDFLSVSKKHQSWIQELSQVA